MSQRDAAVPSHGHVVVCGLQGLGLRIVEELDRLAERVVVIDPAPDHRLRSILARLGVPLVEADPADAEALARCGIPGARALVLTLDQDVANIHAALAAVGMDPSIHVVMRAFDEEFGRRVETLIPELVALSSSAIAAPGFVSALLDEGTDRHLDLLGRDLAVRETMAGDPSVIAVLADQRPQPGALLPVESPPEAPALCLVDASGDPARRGPERVADGRPGSRPHDPPWSAASTGASGCSPRSSSGWWCWRPGVRGVRPGRRSSRRCTRRSRGRGIGGRLGAGHDGAPLVRARADHRGRGDPGRVLWPHRGCDHVGAGVQHPGPHAGDARDHVIVVGFRSVGYRVAMALREQGIGVVAADATPDPRWAGGPAAGHRAGGQRRARPELLRTLHVERALGPAGGHR
ncbi:MAG: NAD-binding protein [Chloroflexota bacterium]